MIKNEKGSVTLLVGVSVLLIIVVLSSSLMLVSIKRKSQLQESKILQEIYGGDLGEIYQEQLEKKSYSDLDPVSISASEITSDLYGKYVDIGLDTNGDGKVNDWELFYAGNGRIFLISADYVPTSKLEEWNVIGEESILGKLGKYGLQKSNTNAHGVCWGQSSSDLVIPWMDLPTVPTNFIELVKHTQYNLVENKTKYNNSLAVSQLLNTNAWSGIIKASAEADKIDFVIGSPTLEMWCEAWNACIPATIGTTTQDNLVNIHADVSQTYGYGFLFGSTLIDWAYMNGTKNKLNNLSELQKNYPLFFPHTTDVGNTDGFLLASPSAVSSNKIVNIDYDGSLGWSDFWDSTYGVRPVVCLNSETNIVWNSEKEVFTLT